MLKNRDIIYLTVVFGIAMLSVTILLTLKGINIVSAYNAAKKEKICSQEIKKIQDEIDNFQLVNDSNNNKAFALISIGSKDENKINMNWSGVLKVYDMLSQETKTYNIANYKYNKITLSAYKILYASAYGIEMNTNKTYKCVYPKAMFNSSVEWDSKNRIFSYIYGENGGYLPLDFVCQKE